MAGRLWLLATLLPIAGNLIASVLPQKIDVLPELIRSGFGRQHVAYRLKFSDRHGGAVVGKRMDVCRGQFLATMYFAQHFVGVRLVAIERRAFLPFGVLALLLLTRWINIGN